MVDYYSTLLRAVTMPGAGDAQWRRGIYERARAMLAQRLRSLDPPPPLRQIATEEAALEAAIERIESELSWSERTGVTDRDDAADLGSEMDRGPIEEPRRMRSVAAIAAVLVIAALAAGGYAFWSGRTHHAEAPKAAMTKEASKPTPKVETREAAPRQTASATPTINVASAGELAPGVDGGSTDTDLPYVYRRQPTFYRTLQPAGTIIVDKLQHFLYVIMPNNVAMRYGIAVGEHCADVAGLRHIASVTDMPPWQPPPDILKRNPPAMPGGPGNRLGARLLNLDDNNSSIHGTNAPKTIGNFVAFGCIRLVNDDVVDLSNRVKVKTPVVVN